MKPPFVRNPYNYDADQVSNETGLSCKGVSLAVQSEKDECDINVIVERFGLTGQVPQNVRAPTYGDFTGISDFRDAIHAVRDADAAFMQMPAHVRARFENDPAQFVDFCSNPANLAEAAKLGLLVPDAVKRLAPPPGDNGAPPAPPVGSGS